MGSTVDLKNTSGYYFSLGSAMISWSSRNQGSIAQYTAEAKFIAASVASKRAVWFRETLSDLFSSEPLNLQSFTVSDQNSVKLAKNPVFSKHIVMRYYYV
jgi:hypothetical protein